MKKPSFILTIAALCGVLLFLLPQASRAGTNLLTTSVQASGANWTAAIWRTNNGAGVGVGTAVSPVAGNTYSMVSNGLTIANGVNSTRVRNPAAAGLQTFPGDSLTMFTNTELRGKTAGAILNFPGVGGNPGLILDGGVLNGGDDTTFAITGRIHVASQSYIANGANGGGGGISANRAFNFTGPMTGTGTMVILLSGLTVPQQASNTTNTFSGQWIVQCGWLRGNVVNSLGTNSITVDPLYAGHLSVMPNFVTVNGPARFEVNYDLNSAGALTLVNGGTMRLHQNVIFSAVTIEGTPLSPGTYFYAGLRATYPNSIEAGGSGSITIQPYGPPPSLGPTIDVQPGPQRLYAGRPAHFTVAASVNGAPPLTFRWRKGGVNLDDIGNITGSTNAALTVAGVSGTDEAIYDVVVSNAGGSVTSAPVALTIASPSGEAYEATVVAANPIAFYQLNETGDPTTNNSPVFDYVGGLNGTFGIAAQNGNPAFNIAGPLAADGFAGFASGNKALQSANTVAASRVAVAPWNLSNNIVTLTAWINPNGPQAASTGLIFCRGGGTVVGLGYSGIADGNGNMPLGYHWNDEPETRGWNTGVVAPSGQWSFVALVVTPSNATIHVMNTNGLLSASQDHPHVIQSFSGTTLIADDSAGADGTRVFNGVMDDVAVFNRALSKAELVSLYTSAAGAVVYAPLLGLQPVSQTLYAGQTAQFTVTGGGSDPLTYHWQAGVIGSGVYANLSDGGRISGSGTPTLTIANINDSDALDYLVTIANSAGSVTSSVATLTVQPIGPAEDITLSVLQLAGSNWETLGAWSDGLAASQSAAGKPGSTYRALPGARMRTPEGPTTTNFPGDVLTMEGNGVWILDPIASSPISEIRFKQVTYGNVNGRVNFKRLVMNGGQLDSGNPNTVEIGGRIDILANTPINNDNAGDRGYLIDAWLTGTGTIEFHGYNVASFQPTFTRPLNIAGTSNTFSGKWNIVMGVLLGSAPGSLGTNDIVIGANGALETLYDINNTNANLLLSGRVFLHQNDTFRTVTINGNSLSAGTYTHAQLATAYPANFPSNWTQQVGSTVSNASGSITVLASATPIIIGPPIASQSLYPSQTAQFTVTAIGLQPLYYQWRKNGTNISDGATPWASTISGVNTTNLSIANLANADGADYVVVITNSVGAITSSISTLIINPVGPPEHITMSAQQPQNNDWNTAADWSDGLPAATSALSKPGSTYEVLPGGRLRSPPNSADVLFPGEVITVSGDGVFAEGGGAIGEIRFKHTPGGIVRFKRLVMNGGQLDSGDNGTTVIAGRMDVLANTPIYADSAAGQDRPYQIDAWLTGNGSIEYRAFDASFGGNLNITGTSNTFSGKWNVVQGVLLGSGPNSLGTNTISVGTTGALETAYDLNNPGANLFLFGQMFLHQNDTFRNVYVGGVGLAAGTYTFAQLTAAYPANFPATWPPQTGSGISTGSGSITVLEGPAALGIHPSGANLILNWPQGSLLEATNVVGPWTENTNASPYIVTPTEPERYFRIQLQ